jgi:fucose permease
LSTPRLSTGEATEELPSGAPVPKAEDRKWTHASRILYLAFILSGAATYISGAMIPALSTRANVSYSALALVFPAQFLASMIGAVLSNRNLRRSTIWGYGLVAVGLAGLTLGWPWVLPALGTIGFGLGLSITATNVLVGRMNPSRRGAALNQVNFMWGVGAIGCQLLFFFSGGAARM